VLLAVVMQSLHRNCQQHITTFTTFHC